MAGRVSEESGSQSMLPKVLTSRQLKGRALGLLSVTVSGQEVGLRRVKFTRVPSRLKSSERPPPKSTPIWPLKSVAVSAKIQ